MTTTQELREKSFTLEDVRLAFEAGQEHTERADENGDIIQETKYELFSDWVETNPFWRV